MPEQVKLHLEVTMPKRWTPQFIAMLHCMRWCAEHGASRTVAFYADGDGDFKSSDFRVANFEFEGPDLKKTDCTLPPESPPSFKTRRRVDFFFDAG